MMNQQQLDETTKNFKEYILDKVRAHGYKNIRIAMMSNAEIRGAIACYELDVVPYARQQGLTVLCAKDLFNVDISVKEADDEN